MKQTRRKWSVEQKLQMIQESVTEGVTPVIRIHNVSLSLFHKWKKQFDLNGLAGLNDNYKRIDPEKRSLETEIKQLRQLVVTRATSPSCAISKYRMSSLPTSWNRFGRKEFRIYVILTVGRQHKV